MARYRQSIWLQVCSSHTIQLMDALILGAICGNEKCENQKSLTTKINKDGPPRFNQNKKCAPQTYVPNVAPILLCSFLCTSLSDSVFNVAISCNEERKHRCLVSTGAFHSIECCSNSPDGLPWKPEQFQAYQQYTFQGPDGAPGLESDPHQTYDTKDTSYMCVMK